MKIPITKPCFGPEEPRAAGAAIQSGWVAQGPRVERFERAVADYCGAAEAVAVSSGTTALHLALLALGIGPGDEVVCPSMSFIATANAIQHAGAKPVFADVEPGTYNLDPRAVEAVLTPRTKAVMVVHQIGLPADLDRLLDLGKRHGLAVFEDAACALGSRYRGQPIGGHSELACFSFHPRKVITTGEGGMITTRRRDLAARLRLLRNHGMSTPATPPDETGRPNAPRFEALGYNFRMSDIHAAVGLAQMEKLEWIVSRRREIARRYTEGLAGHPCLRVPAVPEYATPNYQSFAVEVTDSTKEARDTVTGGGKGARHLLPERPFGCFAQKVPGTFSASRERLRDAFLERLTGAGVACLPGVMLAHREPAYADWNPVALPESEAACDRSMLIPLYPQMTDEEIDHVVKSLWSVCKISGEASADE
ncbi:MAG: DegT/DnrJ/EryC1/StrS family aminotransferase [Pirellulales bacterium]|nr:DegT/DnrJ/EryC1/StrS family aminotransferase [Pirellulales bacterium]